MLHERLRDNWFARLRNGPVEPVPRFAEQGVILGAGTVLLASDGGRRLQRVKDKEARLLALLSADCGEVLPRSIERAAKCWSEGDICLSYIHLAHARLPAPRDVHPSACRLLVAEMGMRVGVAPQIILQALKSRNPDSESVEKFDPGEPRVRAGSGRTSGQWTRVLSWLGELDTSQLAQLGAYASGIVTVSTPLVRWSKLRMDTRGSWKLIGVEGSSQRCFLSRLWTGYRLPERGRFAGISLKRK